MVSTAASKFLSSVLILALLIVASPPAHAQRATTNPTTAAPGIAGPTTGTPVITSSTTATCQLGEDFSYQITARNWPTSYNAAGLPASMRVDARSGRITGTPTGVGTLKMTISASNAKGTGTAVLTLTVNPETPIITSATSASGRAGVAFSYWIVARNGPTSFAASGLPGGLRVNGITGEITGTPAEAGTSKVIISATNAGGTGSAVLTLTVNPAAPFITSATTASGEAGEAFSYQITARNSPTGYSATGLPAGLNLNAITGTITGRPRSAGISSVTIDANNAWGTGTAILTLTVTSGKLMIIGATTAACQVDEAFSYQIAASKNNSLTSYSAVGLPAGLSVSTATGKITGTPTETGTYSVTIGATNAGATGSATLTITVNPAPPEATSVPTTTIKWLK